MAALLELEDVTARYGPVQALHGVSLAVDEGQIAAVLGANGAGKTTTLRAISGTVRRDGELRFAGKRLGRVGPDTVARLGIAHVPEGRGTFAELTVWENLRLGAYTRRGAIKDDLARIQTYFPWLEERRSQQAGTLSGGEQQMLALARAFMQRPRLLLLDEPSLGLAPLVVKGIFDAIRELNRTDGMTIFLVEQNAYHALKLAHRGYVLVNGRVTMSGTGRALLDDPNVKAAYLEGGHAGPVGP
ncbi:MAG: branched-chain amino acid transport system ATP-binding protein [Thermoleophilaceae bacterium]|nr:branched-chain amino acid transport system ATP-binding protein [Thermoleophilaceae bacterium]